MSFFQGPTFAFNDVALQFLGNLLVYFLVKRNESKGSYDRQHLTVIGVTSGDIEVLIMVPKGRVSGLPSLIPTFIIRRTIDDL